MTALLEHVEAPAWPPGPPEPIALGPTWQRNPNWDGESPQHEFVLPEFTLGWQILRWIPENLLDDDGEPFECTNEQKRFILWWYAVNEYGEFVYRDGVLQRLKGWGKDPLLAVICAVEFLGPCRFAGWAAADDPESGILFGEPVGKEHPRAWIFVAAVTKEQTRNTMKIFKGLFNKQCMRRHGMTDRNIAETRVTAHGGKREIQAVTKNPRALEGKRPTFTVRNETHHWIATNDGHAMAEVIARNSDKSRDGAARALSITNAYDPSDDSVAQREREAWEDEDAGRAIKTGILYDSLEIPRAYGFAPPPHPVDGRRPTEQEIRDHIAQALRVVRGDSYWLNINRLTLSILDKKNSPSSSRRWWYNQVEADADASFDPQAITAAVDPLAIAARRRAIQLDDLDGYRVGWSLVMPEDEIVMFFDGSKSDDATGLVGCRLSDGYVFTIGAWQRPPGLSRKDRWLVPRNEVDARVHLAFETFNIVAFWGDPSHTLDDSGSVRYWDGYLDMWHMEYNTRLPDRFWAVRGTDQVHSIMWDMTSPERLKEFVRGVERFTEDIENKDETTEQWAPRFFFDGHPLLRAHLNACRRAPVSLPGHFVGVSVRKENRESPKKIDLAVCAIGARMLRRIVLNRGLEEEDVPGQLWGA